MPGAIGGYQFSPLAPSPDPSAEPFWVKLRQAGKKVVTATWPGADGADIKINGTTVQAAQPTRVANYTVPFGALRRPERDRLHAHRGAVLG